jgi:putative peptidoglycan lipid II flippase
MLASSIITIVAFPLYSLGYRWCGAAGLALSSDAGIALQTISLAVLLHQRRMVSLASLDYAEMGRCLLAAVGSGAGVGVVFWWLGGVAHRAMPGHVQWVDLAVLAAGTALWIAVVKWVLEKNGSELPRVAMKRLRLG